MFCSSCGFPKGGALGGAGSTPTRSFDFNGIMNMVVGMIKAPATTVQESSTAELQNSVILSVIVVLIFGLLGMWFVSSAIHSFIDFAYWLYQNGQSVLGPYLNGLPF